MKKDQFTQLDVTVELAGARKRVAELRPEVKKLADIAKELQTQLQHEGHADQQIDQLKAQVEELVRKVPGLLRD